MYSRLTVDLIIVTSHSLQHVLAQVDISELTTWLATYVARVASWSRFGCGMKVSTVMVLFLAGFFGRTLQGCGQACTDDEVEACNSEMTWVSPTCEAMKSYAQCIKEKSCCNFEYTPNGSSTTARGKESIEVLLHYACYINCSLTNPCEDGQSKDCDVNGSKSFEVHYLSSVFAVIFAFLSTVSWRTAGWLRCAAIRQESSWKCVGGETYWNIFICDYRSLFDPFSLSLSLFVVQARVLRHSVTEVSN